MQQGVTEKHGTKGRRSWRKLHLATDADTGRIVASVLTDKDVDDGSQVGTLLDQVDGPVASFTGDGAYDRDDDGRIKRSSQHLDEGVAMGTRKRRSDQAGRSVLRSPGRPGVARREDRRRFWAAIAAGLASEDAACRAGVSPAVDTVLRVQC